MLKHGGGDIGGTWRGIFCGKNRGRESACCRTGLHLSWKNLEVYDSSSESKNRGWVRALLAGKRGELAGKRGEGGAASTFPERSVQETLDTVHCTTDTGQ